MQSGGSDLISVFQVPDAAGPLPPPNSVTAGPGLRPGVFVADVNGDRHPDLVTQNDQGIVSVAGDGAGGFAAFQVQVATADLVPPGDLAGTGSLLGTADVNDDGRAEILTGSFTLLSVRVRVWTATPAGPFVPVGTFFAGGLPQPADLDSDGRLDVVVTLPGTNLSNRGVSHYSPSGHVHFGDGHGGFAATTAFYSSPPIDPADHLGSFGASVADLDRDGQPDVLLAASASRATPPVLVVRRTLPGRAFARSGRGPAPRPDRPRRGGRCHRRRRSGRDPRPGIPAQHDRRGRRRGPDQRTRPRFRRPGGGNQRADAAHGGRERRGARAPDHRRRPRLTGRRRLRDRRRRLLGTDARPGRAVRALDPLPPGRTRAARGDGHAQRTHRRGHDGARAGRYRHGRAGGAARGDRPSGAGRAVGAAGAPDGEDHGRGQPDGRARPDHLHGVLPPRVERARRAPARPRRAHLRPGRPAAQRTCPASPPVPAPGGSLHARDRGHRRHSLAPHAPCGGRAARALRRQARRQS